MWGFNTFLSRNIMPKLYLYVGAVFTAGGKAYVNGVPAGVALNNWQGLVGFGAKLWKGVSIVGTYSQTIDPPPNNPHSRSFLLLVQQSF